MTNHPRHISLHPDRLCIVDWHILICLEPTLIYHLLLEPDRSLIETIDGMQKFQHNPSRTLVPCRLINIDINTVKFTMKEGLDNISLITSSAFSHSKSQ